MNLSINDLSKNINGKSKPISFADDTSIIFIISNLTISKMIQKLNLNPSING